MINLQIEIRGDADKNNELQARGVVAALYSIFGAAVLPQPLVTVTNTIGNVSQSISGSPETVLRAADGYPEPSAAEAFGATPEPSAAEAFGAQPPVDNAHVAAGATPFPTADVDRDKNGIPWDERIHSDRSGSTGGKNQDGSWKRKRNTPDDTYNSVMAELRAGITARTLEAASGVGGAVPLPPSTTASSSAPATPALAPSPTPAAADASSSAPAVPAPPAASTPATAAPEGTVPATTFPAIMMKVTKAQNAGKCTPEALGNLLASVGVQKNPDGKYSVIALSKNPELIPAFDALLEDHIQ